ncbi:MAG TPA: YdeI/OmpD-associated family protein [Gemmatimonadaceae bacterium]
MKPTFFEAPAEFRRWLEQNHESASELWVGFWKKGSGRPSITWPESVDEALCFGWIDGVRKALDGESYVIRFTPRRLRRSTWSAVNTKRAQELIEAGRMRPAGLRAFEARDAARSGVYSFEQRQQATLTRDQKKQFRANKQAWAFFQAQPPGYRKIVAFWVTSAKREETRARRLRTLMEDSAAGRRIGILRRE